jgi:hypothetical protein
MPVCSSPAVSHPGLIHHPGSSPEPGAFVLPRRVPSRTTGALQRSPLCSSSPIASHRGSIHSPVSSAEPWAFVVGRRHPQLPSADAMSPCRPPSMTMRLTKPTLVLHDHPFPNGSDVSPGDHDSVKHRAGSKYHHHPHPHRHVIAKTGLRIDIGLVDR